MAAGDAGGPAVGRDPFIAGALGAAEPRVQLREAEEALRGAPEGAPLEELVQATR